MKINISLPDELAERVDAYCAENCLKRSIVYQIAVSQFINQRLAASALQDIALTLKKIDEKGMLDDESRKMLSDFEAVVKIVQQG